MTTYAVHDWHQFHKTGQKPLDYDDDCCLPTSTKSILKARDSLSSRLSSKNTSNKDRRCVRFSPWMEVILVPHKSEFMHIGLISSLWYKRDEYHDFLHDANSEIKMHCLCHSVTWKEAKRQLYQLEEKANTNFQATNDVDEYKNNQDNENRSDSTSTTSPTNHTLGNNKLSVTKLPKNDSLNSISQISPTPKFVKNPSFSRPLVPKAILQDDDLELLLFCVKLPRQVFKFCQKPSLDIEKDNSPHNIFLSIALPVACIILYVNILQ